MAENKRDECCKTHGCETCGPCPQHDTPNPVTEGTTAHRIITDHEDLETLTEDTVIRHVNTAGWSSIYELWPDGWHGLGLVDEPVSPRLPATVIYDPTQK